MIRTQWIRYVSSAAPMSIRVCVCVCVCAYKDEGVRLCCVQTTGESQAQLHTHTQNASAGRAAAARPSGLSILLWLISGRRTSQPHSLQLSSRGFEIILKAWGGPNWGRDTDPRPEAGGHLLVLGPSLPTNRLCVCPCVCVCVCVCVCERPEIQNSTEH